MLTQLKGYTCLSNSVSFYIPSTRFDRKLDQISFKRLQKETSRFFSGLFGGCTLINTTGNFIADNKQLISEKIIICESFCSDSDLYNNISKVIDYCKKIKAEFNQESIALEINKQLYFI